MNVGGISANYSAAYDAEKAQKAARMILKISYYKPQWQGE